MKFSYRRAIGVHPRRSLFNLSHTYSTTCDMGQIIPVLYEECMPGDYWRIHGQLLIRMQPLVSPVMHNITATVHTWFIPYRIIWDQWEDFYTRGPRGDLIIPLPNWSINANETMNVMTAEEQALNKRFWLGTDADFAAFKQGGVGSLSDYFGLPLTLDTINPGPNTTAVLDFFKRAYISVWNEWYRDETLSEEIALDANLRVPLLACWRKDYFTSALPFQQRGTAPAIPLGGVTSAIWPEDVFKAPLGQGPGTGTFRTVEFRPDSANGGLSGGSGFAGLLGNGALNELNNLRNWFNSNKVDLSTVNGVDVPAMRLAFQLQRILERNAVCGSRYAEQLLGRFGTNAGDARLQRPEYIGGYKMPIIVSEVLQTSASTAASPQGNMAGHGIGVSGNHVGSYKVREHGCIMQFLIIRPDDVYSQGIDRQYQRQDSFDFPDPAFAHLSEQAVLYSELYYAGGGNDGNIFGYQGIFNEMRKRQSRITGELRGNLTHWTLARIFANQPALNESFVLCRPDKRIFAVQDEPGFIIQVGHDLRVARPLPVYPTPGGIDHG